MEQRRSRLFPRTAGTPRGHRARVVWTGLLVGIVAAGAPPGWAGTQPGGAPAGGTGPQVTVEPNAGERLAGRLESLGDQVRLVTADGSRVVAITDVRRLVVTDPPASTARAALVVQLVDGGRIAADGFTCVDRTAVIEVGTARIELPLDRVRWAAAAGPPADPAAWRATLPDRLESDVILVDRGGERELVACAVVAIDADTVTILLDGERIRVKRPRVVAVEWLRSPAPPGGTKVLVTGGALTCDTVTWTDAGLVLDGAVTLPAALLREIDYAAGRTVPLVTLTAERLVAEPFFGRLMAVEGLAAFFGPRFVAGSRTAGAADGPTGADLVMRPRSEAVWRLPPHGRRFKARVAAAAGPQAAGSADVVVLVDEREVFRRRLDGPGAPAAPGGEPAATGAGPGGPGAQDPPPGRDGVPAESPRSIDVAVADGRRLTIRVDFVAGGGLGCPVRFIEPRFER